MNSVGWPGFKDVVRAGHRCTARVDFDSRFPCLDHHRPGGVPLFGTVLGIETLAAAAQALTGLPEATVLENVEIHAPYRVTDDAPALGVTVERLAGEDSVVAATLSSGARGERLHFRCRVVCGDASREPAGWERPRLTAYADAVTAADIYDVFFHGPAYRVLAGAAFGAGRIVARAATDLPELFGTPPAPTAFAPRVVEFALQSAGLHALASFDKLLIPHRIRRVWRRARVQDVGGSAAWAVAAPPTATPDSPLDVRVYDAEGQLALDVAGYETVALPFEVDRRRVRTLGLRLRHESLDRSTREGQP